MSYVRFPHEEAEKVVLSMGMSADAARLFTEMYKGVNDGTYRRTEARSPANSTATSIEEFAKTFAAVYNG